MQSQQKRHLTRHGKNGGESTQNHKMFFFGCSDICCSNNIVVAREWAHQMQSKQLEVKKCPQSETGGKEYQPGDSFAYLIIENTQLWLAKRNPKGILDRG